MTSDYENNIFRCEHTCSVDAHTIADAFQRSKPNRQAYLLNQLADGYYWNDGMETPIQDGLIAGLDEQGRHWILAMAKKIEPPPCATPFVEGGVKHGPGPGCIS